jgi:hypothetical protein
MYLYPTYFIDLGLRALMRNPFFSLTRLSKVRASFARWKEGRDSW